MFVDKKVTIDNKDAQVTDESRFSKYTYRNIFAIIIVFIIRRNFRKYKNELV